MYTIKYLHWDYNYIYMMTESKIKETRYSKRHVYNETASGVGIIYTIEKPYKCSILYCIVQVICMCRGIWDLYVGNQVGR